ncbi:hypothetical protein PMAYCL1PPCAC_19376, partial [Pristionchus mayeri]
SLPLTAIAESTLSVSETSSSFCSFEMIDEIIDPRKKLFLCELICCLPGFSSSSATSTAEDAPQPMLGYCI